MPVEFQKNQMMTLTVFLNETLKNPSQPSPFSMTSKLLILHGEAKSCCFMASCVPESMFNYLM